MIKRQDDDGSWNIEIQDSESEYLRIGFDTSEHELHLVVTSQWGFKPTVETLPEIIKALEQLLKDMQAKEQGESPVKRYPVSWKATQPEENPPCHRPVGRRVFGNEE